jgi:hypothetical protein
MRSVADFSLTTHLLKKLYVHKVAISPSSESLSAILEKYPKLVVAMNHGSQVGALSGLLGLVDQYYQHGGANRHPFGITWRGFYKLPGYKQFFSYLTQVDSIINSDDAVKLLTESDFTDCVIMPEGEYCNFGNGIDVQPFLSPKFIELAIRAKTPVLVVAQKGSEVWSWPIEMSDSLMGLADWLPVNLKTGLKRSRILNIPKPWRKKINELRLSFYLYHPKLTEWDLDKDDTKRLRQLKVEANKVRSRMQLMVNTLVLESEDDDS